MADKISSWESARLSWSWLWMLFYLLPLAPAPARLFLVCTRVASGGSWAGSSSSSSRPVSCLARELLLDRTGELHLGQDDDNNDNNRTDSRSILCKPKDRPWHVVILIRSSSSNWLASEQAITSEELIQLFLRKALAQACPSPHFGALS